MTKLKLDFIITKYTLAGAYDSGYRKVLRTTYPFAAWILDLLMKKEEETVLRDDQISEQAASSKFMDQLKKPNSSKPV